MKVCQLCAVDFTLNKFLLPLIDGMRKEGWDDTAVCSNGPFVSDMRSQGYHIITIPIARSINPFSALRSIIALTRLFHRERFDVLHVHTPVAALLGRIAARIAGVPLSIYTAHGFYFHDEMPALKRWIYIGLERLGGYFTDFLFTQSAEDADAATLLGIMYKNKVLVIGNGVDVERFDPMKQDHYKSLMNLGIPSNARVVGIIGRLVQEKGYLEFLRAAEIVGKTDKSVYFLVVGERLESDYNAHIDKELACARQVLGSRLILAGLREDIPTMLAAMDIFCLPSYREGMPRTIIEAMMMSKPVIATNIRGAREEVVDGKTGILVATCDIDALVKALVCLLDDADLREHMGREGRERALTLYDERNVVAIQIKKILELVQRTGQ